MSEKIDVSQYPEGLTQLAAKLTLPIPAEETAKREAYVMAFVNAVIRL